MLVGCEFHVEGSNTEGPVPPGFLLGFGNGRQRRREGV